VLAVCLHRLVILSQPTSVATLQISLLKDNISSTNNLSFLKIIFPDESVGTQVAPTPNKPARTHHGETKDRLS
jgi:hypothetical protein